MGEEGEKENHLDVQIEILKRCHFDDVIALAGASDYCWEYADLEPYLRTDWGGCKVAVHDNKVVGFILCTAGKEPDDNKLYIRNLCVDEGARRQGVGSKMVQYFTQGACKEFNQYPAIDSVVVEVDEKREDLQKFFSTLKFSSKYREHGGTIIEMSSNVITPSSPEISDDGCIEEAKKSLPLSFTRRLSDGYNSLPRGTPFIP